MECWETDAETHRSTTPILQRSAPFPMNTIPQTVNLGSIEQIPLGQGRCYVVSETEIAVFRQRDGRLFATQNRCPHKQGPLSEGVAGGGKVICPLHAHKFDLATGQGSEPAECVKTYAVSEANGEILLQI
jgi:nitrite reductase (NADH) small subunit